MKLKSIAFALCATMLFSLSACSDKPSVSIKAGTYSAKEKGYGGEVSAAVTVDDKGKITALKIEGAGETADVGGKAIPKITDAILKDQTVLVDVVTGATVTSKAALAAVTAALKSSGVDTDSMKAPEKTGVDSEKTTEVVIVGCGASGMTAALAAAEKGAKVIVVEQTSSYGGTALMGAEGFFAVGSEQQKKAGDKTTTDEMYDWFMEYNHEKSYSPLTRNWLEMTAGTVDWLAGYGNPATLMENTQLAHKEQIQTYHKFDDKVTGFKNMYDNMLKMGVEVIFDTKVTDLILDSEGKAVGIIGTKNDGGKLKVNSAAVILSSGGFAANPEMLEENVGLSIGEYSLMTAGSTGEGIKMAQKAGAGSYALNIAAYHGAMLPDGNSFVFSPIMMTAAPVWVDNSGARFTNEEVVYDFALWGNAAFNAGGSYWAIIDSASAKKFAEEGCPYTHSFMKTILVATALDKSVFPSVVRAPEDIAADPKFIENLDNLANTADWIVKADTIEELAAKMNVPVDRLKTTIGQYNKAVESKDDSMFNKNSKYLEYSIEEGPFYALSPRVLCEGSLGGISANEKLQAVKDDWTIIPGLYASGNNVGMIYDNSYPVMEGVTLSFALNSGRIAGYSAAEEVLGK